MASLRDYYRNMAEENARLQEELRQARAEQGDNTEKAEAFDYLTGRGDSDE
jgi:hypothetical protein